MLSSRDTRKDNTYIGFVLHPRHQQLVLYVVTVQEVAAKNKRVFGSIYRMNPACIG